MAHEYHVEYEYWRMALHAIHPSRCYAAASALLSPEYWMQEYDVVFDALRCIAAGEFEEEALEFAIWKQDAERVWNVCELWRMHEIMSDQQEISFFEVCCLSYCIDTFFSSPCRPSSQSPASPSYSPSGNKCSTLQIHPKNPP